MDAFIRVIPSPRVKEGDLQTPEASTPASRGNFVGAILLGLLCQRKVLYCLFSLWDQSKSTLRE